MVKYTRKQMYEFIIEAAETGVFNVSPAVVVDFCKRQMALIDQRYARDRVRANQHLAADDDLTQAIIEALSDEFYEPLPDILERVNHPEVTTSKLIYRLNQLHKQGLVSKVDLQDDKNRIFKGYKLGE